MAKYHADLRDITFNLFDVLKVQRLESFGLSEQDYRGILDEYIKFVQNEVFPTRESSDVHGVKHENGKVTVAPELHAITRAFYDLSLIHI